MNEDITYINEKDIIMQDIVGIWQTNFPEENFIDFESNDKKLKLTTYRYILASNPKAIVVFFHGLGGYMKTSSYLAKNLAENNCAFVGYDYKGHGKSEGKRTYFRDIEELISDSINFIQKIKEIYQNLPIFLGGISLGANIAYRISSQDENKYKGIFMFAPALKPVQGCFMINLANCLGSLFPCCALTTGDPKSNSRNEYSLDQMQKDPLINKGKTPLGSIKAVLNAMRCENSFKYYKENFIVFMGAKDVVVDVGAVFNLLKNSPSKNKKMYFYKNMYHGVLIEEEMFDISAKLIEWVNKSLL